VLEQQVQRMLADPRAEALVSNFTGQWLNVRAIRGRGSHRHALPDFDDTLRLAFQREVELFFGASAGRSQRHRSADRRLHVRQRTSGAALRDSERVRQPVSAG
jgi:hypothetical protein